MLKHMSMLKFKTFERQDTINKIKQQTTARRPHFSIWYPEQVNNLYGSIRKT